MSSETVHAVTFTAGQQAELLELEADPTPLSADEIAGPTLCSLISPGTEIGVHYEGESFPCRPGYTAVFRVEAVGEAVDDLAVGDRVLTTGPGDIGGHRSAQRVPRSAALKVPDGLEPGVACHARLMGVSMSTLTTTTARPPQKVMITGLGPIGHLAAQLWQACGYDVIAVDPMQRRRQLACEKGVRTVLPAVPLDDKVRLEDVELCMECAGHEQAVLDACKAVRPGGEVVLIGLPRRRKADVQVFDLLQPIYRRYVRLRSGWEWELPRHPAGFRKGSIFGNLAGALRWLAQGRVDVAGLYEMALPADCQRVYQDLLHRRSSALTVAFDWAGIG